MRFRWLLWLLPALLLVGCGIPISPDEITATAQSKQADAQLSGSSLSALSAGRSSDASFREDKVGVDVTPTPVATLQLAEGDTSEDTATPEVADAEADGDAEADATATGESNSEATETAGLTAEATETVDATATPAPEVAALTVSSTDMAQEALRILNQVRIDNGLEPLNVDPALMQAAQNYAQYMAVNNYFGHTGADGSTSDSRIAAAGYGGVCMGEAISAGQKSAQAAITAWMNSPRHRAILLESRAEDVGLGYYYSSNSYYGGYWVLDTGVPAGWGCGG